MLYVPVDPGAPGSIEEALADLMPGTADKED